MNNPLKPTYRERERAPDKLEMEYHADLQMMMPDFDERLRAHEEKHDPLNEFTGGNLTITGYPPAVVIAPMDVDETKYVTIALTGVSAQGVAGTVGVLKDEPERPPEPVLLFEGTKKAAAFLSNSKSRKKTLKRISDEDQDLQGAFAEGRYIVMFYRTACLWYFMVKLELKETALPPLMAWVSKHWATVWASIIWLFTWK
jgi:hypothetical protein